MGDYKKIINDNLESTNKLLKGNDDDLKRRLDIDNLLRSYVDDKKLLNFLKARNTDVTLSFNKEKHDTYKLTLNQDGTICIDSETSGTNYNNKSVYKLIQLENNNDHEIAYFFRKEESFYPAIKGIAVNDKSYP